MIAEHAAVRRSSRWLAVIPLFFAASSARCLPSTDDQPTTSAVPEALKSLDGVRINPIRSDNKQTLDDSTVMVRYSEAGSSGGLVELEVRLRSLPNRSAGPDNDRAGADADIVRVRGVRVVAGPSTKWNVRRFHQWFDAQTRPAVATAQAAPACQVYYTGATREYATGSSGPAYFESRCLVRIAAAQLEKSLFESANGSSAPAFSLHLDTDAGVLEVPLIKSRGERNASRAREIIFGSVRSSDFRNNMGHLSSWN